MWSRSVLKRSGIRPSVCLSVRQTSDTKRHVPTDLSTLSQNHQHPHTSSVRLRSVAMATASLNHVIHVAYHVPAPSSSVSAVHPSRPSLPPPAVVISLGIVFLYSLPFPARPFAPGVSDTC